jgi:hypothetical protein
MGSSGVKARRDFIIGLAKPLILYREAFFLTALAEVGYHPFYGSVLAVLKRAKRLPVSNESAPSDRSNPHHSKDA